LRLTWPTEGFRWDDLRKIWRGDQGMAWVHSGEEILPKPRARTLQTTDDRQADRQTDLR